MRVLDTLSELLQCHTELSGGFPRDVAGGSRDFGNSRVITQSNLGQSAKMNWRRQGREQRNQADHLKSKIKNEECLDRIPDGETREISRSGAHQENLGRVLGMPVTRPHPRSPNGTDQPHVENPGLLRQRREE